MTEQRPPRRTYNNGTLAGLMTLARGGCYAPDCGVPTIRMINGVPVFNLEIAHIRAFEEGGKRFDAGLSVPERNNITNLLLLCSAHHKVVDGTSSDKYTVQVLMGWKRARETDGLDALVGLGQLTEARLAMLIASAQGELLDRLGPALDEFSKTAPELAALLRTVVDELADPRLHGFGISEDAIQMLHSSARTFANLEDSASTLAYAASRLENLEHHATALRRAAEAAQRAASALSDARR